MAQLVGALAEEMEVSKSGDMAVARVTGHALALSAEALLGRVVHSLPGVSRLVTLQGPCWLSSVACVLTHNNNVVVRSLLRGISEAEGAGGENTSPSLALPPATRWGCTS